MDVVYFGSGAFGLPTLERLASEHRLRAAITQPDRPAGRGGRLAPTPVADWIRIHRPDVPVLTPERVRDAIDEIREIPADAWVVIAYGQKLPRRLLDGRFACNLHASRLPRWRGAAPINAAVLAGDAETGNSVITIADRMDAGDVLARSTISIHPEQTAGELHDRLAADGPDLVEWVLRDYGNGTLRAEPQDEALATLAPKLAKSDAWIDFSRPAEHCRRRVHGLTPWPGVLARLAGALVKLCRVRALESRVAGEPGELLDSTLGLVACAPGTCLELVEVQPAGGRAMAWADFARGRRPAPGATICGVVPVPGHAPPPAP